MRQKILHFIRCLSKALNKKLTDLDVFKATGIDQIPARVLKDGASAIDLHLANIVNLTINHATFPLTCTKTSISKNELKMKRKIKDPLVFQP